jgi:2-keto-4-pentenoate hydratase/2-oxohepta-3-ene-1,7-dioic acid hydratase in catechol pathway
MKLIRFRHGQDESWGVARDERIADARQAWPDGPADIDALLAAGHDAMIELARRTASADAAIPLTDVAPLAPIARPGKSIGLAGNYAEHVREFAPAGGDNPEDPTRETTTPRPFLMPPTVIADPDTEIAWPDYSDEIDYEVELCVVIGQTCKAIPAARARDVVAGYTIANDISARRCTHADGRAERQPKDGFFDWLHGKWADGFLPIGPVLVTPDEIPDPQALAIESRVDGELRQQANTGQMIFDVFELIAFISRLMTLQPGDLIATGTPAGVGKATGRLLTPGQTVACRIEAIGELSNTLSARPAEWYRPCQNPAGGL